MYRHERYGKNQLLQVLEDRPSIREVLHPDGSLASWIACCFDGSGVGSRVYWDNEEPVTGRPAEHQIPFYGYPAVVRVTSASNVSGLDKLSLLIYEFFNVRYHEDSLRIRDQALAGELDREAFATKLVELEHQAMLGTNAFLLRRGFDREVKVSDPLTRSILKTPEDFGAFMTRDPQYDHRLYFEEAYDEFILPYIRPTASP